LADGLNHAESTRKTRIERNIGERTFCMGR
jgi:hypothetical protein